MYQIVSDMPLPERRHGAGAAQKYNFDRIEVGQAMIFPADDGGFFRRSNGVLLHRARNAAIAHGKAHGKKFASRLLPDGRFGVWRIA